MERSYTTSFGAGAHPFTDLSEDQEVVRIIQQTSSQFLVPRSFIAAGCTCSTAGVALMGYEILTLVMTGISAGQTGLHKNPIDYQQLSVPFQQAEWGFVGVSNFITR